MTKKNMIAWFVKELKLPRAAIAAIINTHPDVDRRYSAANVKQMMLGRQQWPENTWDARRHATMNEMTDFIERAERINESCTTEFKVSQEDLSAPFGTLGVIMACMSLEGNTSVLLE